MKPKDFVAIARTARTVGEIIEKTGLTHAAVSNRLSRYRKLGIKLPRFNHPSKIDVKEINGG